MFLLPGMAFEPDVGKFPYSFAEGQDPGPGQSSGCDSTGLGFYMEMPLRDSPALQTFVEISLFCFDLSFACLFSSSAIVMLSSGGPATMDQPLCSRHSGMYGILRRLHMQQYCDGGAQYRRAGSVPVLRRQLT